MEFPLAEFFSFGAVEDSWPFFDNPVSAETSTPDAAPEFEKLSIMDTTQNPLSSYQANGIPRTYDNSFQNFGQEQHATGIHANVGPMLHFHGSTMPPSRGFQVQKVVTSPANDRDQSRRRRERSPRNGGGERPMKRKRANIEVSGYNHQENSSVEVLSYQYRERPVCDDDCISDAGSGTSCCSSCPDAPPCEDPHCAIPCAESSCDLPPCPEDCPEVCPQTQHMQFQQGLVSRSDKVSYLQYTQAEAWNTFGRRQAHSGKAVYHDTCIDPVLSTPNSDSQYKGEPESSGSPTPSMVQNMATPYSPKATIQTPQFMGQTRTTYPTESSTVNGAGSMFPPAMGDWNDADFADSGDDSWIYNCSWDSCNATIPDQQSWIQHLHQAHLDPQYNYDCPLQSNDCSTNIGVDPLNHLQTQHGFNMNESFSCPAPTCSPAETYNDPAMFHNHFDLAHAIPAQGFLQCRLNSCNHSFVDQNQLLSHIHETHPLPVPTPKVATKVEIPTYPTAIAETDGMVTHLCKWKLHGGGVCGENCGSEKDLQDHVKAKHLASLSKSTGYICQWERCNRPAKMGSKQGFSQRGKLERHMASHTNYVLSRTSNEATQAPPHRRETMEMQVLRQMLPQQSACTIHERTHTKDKPLECEICGKKFSESSNFAKHRRIHGELGKHACGIPGCGKTFHRSDQLKKHLKVHSRTHDGGLEGEEDEGEDDEKTDRSS